jgi:hypothetical protein
MFSSANQDRRGVVQSPITILCGRCDSEMIAGVHEAGASQLKARGERPPATRIQLAVWRCITCGAVSPRLG